MPSPISTQSNALALFDNSTHQIRALLVNGEPAIIARDLCAALDIRNHNDALASLDSDEKGVVSTDTPGGVQQLAFVTEAGMYSLVLRSRKPEAKAVKRWLTHEVIPSIRKTGSYSVQHALPQTFAEALRQLADTAEANEALTAKVEADAPKVDYIDTYVADEDLRKIRDVAKSLNITENGLREALLEHRWIFREKSSRWSEKQQEVVPHNRYSAYADKTNYFTPRPDHEAPRFKGEVMHTLKVTPAGAAAIAKQARIWGLVPRLQAVV